MKVSLDWVKEVSNVDVTKIGKTKLLEKVGQQLGAIDEVKKVGSDTIIDIENKMFTHRPDCFGMLGIARELAGIQGLAFKSPSWYFTPHALEKTKTRLPLVVRNDVTTLVPRFMAVAIDHIKVAPSPAWMKSHLERIGIKSINNIVDITNYIMMLTGQPLHAFDYDKLAALDGADTAAIVARRAKPGEQIHLLNGKKYKLDGQTVVLASAKHPADVAGIMGGKETEVGSSTTRIVLTCANFDMYAVRRASMHYGLFTDAVTRFTKGQSPLQTEVVLYKAIQEISQHAGGQVAGPVYDLFAKRPTTHTIKVDCGFINERLGLKLTAKAMETLLHNVEFVVRTEGETLKVTPPFWRTDIHIHEDIVEEIGRLHGYDQLPLELPLRNLKAAPHDELFDFKQQLRETLSRSGANEVLTYSFVHGDLMKKAGQDPAHAYQLANALSPELQYYRTGLTPSLLDKVHLNIRAGFDQLALFEVNKVHYLGEMDETDPGVPNEDNHLALVLAYNDKHQPAGAAYYHARKYLEQIAGELTGNLTLLTDFDLRKDEWGRQLTAPYEPRRSAVIVKDGQIWGVVGEYRGAVRQALKLPAFSAGFEINLGILSQAATSYQPLPRFPKVSQDMTLRVPLGTSYAEVYRVMRSAVEKLAGNAAWQLSPVDIYQPKSAKQWHLTLRLEIASYQRTLQATEVNSLLDKSAAAGNDKLGVSRI